MNYPLVFANINLHALGLGGVTLFILFFTPKFISKIVPVQLLALILMTGVASYFGFNVEKISSIVFSLPQFQMPHFTVDLIMRDIPTALTLAFIATSESLLTGIIMDSLTKIKHNSKRLIMAQGFGNLFCAITGSMVGAAATMRSVAAVKSGAKTRWAAILASGILVLVLFKFTSFISQIPICVLAAILIKIGYDILDLKVLKVLKYAPKDDLYVLIAVLLLTVFYNLIFALGIGIILAALLYAKRIADDTNVKITHYNHLDYTPYEAKVEKDSHYKIRILHIDGQFFFGYNLIFALGIGIILAALLYAKRIADDTNVKITHYNHLDYTPYEAKVEKDSHYKIRILHIDGQFFFGSITQIVSHFDVMLETEYIILNYSSNTELDMSAIFALEDIIVRLRDQKIKLLLVLPGEKVYEQIKSIEVISQLGEDAIFTDENEAITTALSK